MNSQTRESLEWDKIQSQLLAQCQSPEGYEILKNFEILHDLSQLKLLQSRVDPFLRHLQGQNPLPSGDFPRIQELLEQVRVEGSVLDGNSLKASSIWLLSAGRLTAFLLASTHPYLKELGLEMPRLDDLGRRLGQYFDSEGILLEDEVPALRLLTRERAKVRGEMGKKAQELLGIEENRDLWQSHVPTQKDGRVVLALKSNFKGRVPGIVHESSGSGATLYFEPLELVEKNNRLAEIHHEYLREIHKLLSELTAKLRERLHEIGVLRQQVAHVDSLNARARLGWLHQGEFPVLSPHQSELDLRQARHPLLGKKAVPINLHPGVDIQALLISGPNTGGKTATLKTAGLLSLMNQMGIPIPASPDSVLPLYDGVLCDIGDGQSLEGHLSTFSSHMKRLSLILEQATPQSLILLDELGSGTDPEEGGALSVALLEALLLRGPRILVTTHHSRLKEFALATPGVSNASVEFDEDSQRPTYRILPGLPGMSHALEIALQQGLPLPLIERARGVMQQGETEASTVLKRLKDEEYKLMERERALDERWKEAVEARRVADLRFLKAKQQETELREQGLGDFRRFLKESRSLFEGLIKGIRERGKASSQEIQEVRAFIALQEDQVRQDELSLIESQAEVRRLSGLENTEPLTWEVGQEVWLEDGSKKGVIVSLGNRDTCVVSVGSMRWTLRLDRIRRVEGITKAPKVEILTQMNTDLTPVFTLDIRGLRWDEARERLQYQLDAALIKGLETFQVIHGLGEGILQKQVQEYLRGRNEVQRYHFATPEEGGFGKTIVYL